MIKEVTSNNFNLNINKTNETPPVLQLKEIISNTFSLIINKEEVIPPIQTDNLDEALKDYTAKFEHIRKCIQIANEKISEKAFASDSEISKNTKEIEDAKGEYDTLKTRLDRENEKVYETINSKDFLPFEGENVTVEHSKVGYTKDMKVEGRTLYKKADGSYTDVFEEGCTLESVAETDGNKISILSRNKNLIDVNTFDKLIEGTRSVTIKDNNSITIKDSQSATWRGYYIYRTLKPNTDYVFKADVTVRKGQGGLIVNYSDGSGIAGITEGTSANNYTCKFRTDNRCDVKIRFQYAWGTETDGDIDFDNIQLEENTVNTPYVAPTINKKEILLPYSNGFKGFPNGAKDQIYNKEDGCYVKQKIGKKLLNTTIDSWFLRTDLNLTNETFITFQMAFPEAKESANVNDFMCNVLTNKSRWDALEEGCWFDNNLIITLKKSKLSEPNLEGFKNWLIANNVEAYYVLAKTIEYKITDLNSINLETFRDVTHIFSENSISPNLNFKAPVDVPATISTLRVRNEGLEQENSKLKEEVDTKTLKLHGQDVELTSNDLDLDFRIFEIETSIGLPINLNMKGMRSMARSPFEMMKILVLNNNYDREDIEYKASRYLKGGRMTQTEYNEIISLMDANEVIQ